MRAIFLLSSGEVGLKGFEEKQLTPAEIEAIQIKEKTAWQLGKGAMPDDDDDKDKKKSTLKH